MLRDRICSIRDARSRVQKALLVARSHGYARFLTRLIMRLEWPCVSGESAIGAARGTRRRYRRRHRRRRRRSVLGNASRGRREGGRHRSTVGLHQLSRLADCHRRDVVQRHRRRRRRRRHNADL